jgi:hypothetical protein
VATPAATAAGANILARRPNPAFGAVLLLDSDQYSDDDGLQLTFTQRAWRRLSFNGFYTLSKTMTSMQPQNNTTQGLAQNSSDLAGDYGRADTDPRIDNPAPAMCAPRLKPAAVCTPTDHECLWSATLATDQPRRGHSHRRRRQGHDADQVVLGVPERVLQVLVRPEVGKPTAIVDDEVESLQDVVAEHAQRRPVA